MRLDYTLYVLAVILLIITVVPFVAPIGVETTETKSLWVVSTVVLGLLSIGLGYSQRPKTAAQACQPARTVETPAMKGAPTVDLTQVKGIGEKRAVQLKALGINSADELTKASAETIAKKLKISPKIVNKWIDSAKELVE